MTKYLPLLPTMRPATNVVSRQGLLWLTSLRHYDTCTLRKRGLLLKACRILKCQTTVNILTSILGKRRFRVSLGGQTSWIRTLNDGLPQGSFLAPMLFNICEWHAWDNFYEICIWCRWSYFGHPIHRLWQTQLHTHRGHEEHGSWRTTSTGAFVPTLLRPQSLLATDKLGLNSMSRSVVSMCRMNHCSCGIVLCPLQYMAIFTISGVTFCTVRVKNFKLHIILSFCYIHA